MERAIWYLWFQRYSLLSFLGAEHVNTLFSPLIRKGVICFDDRHGAVCHWIRNCWLDDLSCFSLWCISFTPNFWYRWSNRCHEYIRKLGKISTSSFVRLLPSNINSPFDLLSLLSIICSLNFACRLCRKKYYHLPIWNSNAISNNFLICGAYAEPSKSVNLVWWEHLICLNSHASLSLS